MYCFVIQVPQIDQQSACSDYINEKIKGVQAKLLVSKEMVYCTASVGK